MMTSYHSDISPAPVVAHQHFSTAVRNISANYTTSLAYNGTARQFVFEFDLIVYNHDDEPMSGNYRLNGCISGCNPIDIGTYNSSVNTLTADDKERCGISTPVSYTYHPGPNTFTAWAYLTLDNYTSTTIPPAKYFVRYPIENRHAYGATLDTTSPNYINITYDSIPDYLTVTPDLSSEETETPVMRLTVFMTVVVVIPYVIRKRHS